MALIVALSPCMVDAPAAQTQARPVAAAARAPRLRVDPQEPAGGSLVRVMLDQLAPSDDSVVTIEGRMAGEPLHFVRDSENNRQALGAIPVDATDSLVARVLLAHASGRVDTVSATVLLAPAPPRPSITTPGTKRLKVDSRFATRMSAATRARIARENELARRIGRRAQDTPRLWTAPFRPPRAAVVTGKFGTGRVFNGQLSSRHLGVDYRGAVGQPIFASNRGVVALVARFYLAGNVVYIDHGDGLVTGYFHMSRSEVAVGDTVERGQTIGLVGATGRVTGPHLHWNARFGATTINPGDLLHLAAPFVTPDSAR